MDKLDIKEFEVKSLANKYQMLKNEGNFVASRIFGGHQVHLFTLRGVYIEVYRILGLNQIQWIEVLKNQKIIDDYLDNL